MAKTFADALARCRRLLRDPTTRPDGSTITPFHSNGEILDAVNAAVKNRVGLVDRLHKDFYKTTKTYTGRTDAQDSDYEQYRLPGRGGDSSSIFRHWLVLRRTDLETKPMLPKIEAEQQEPVFASIAGLFSGIYAQYPENLAPGDQCVSIISGDRFRIKPAPASTDETFTLWYKRMPTEMDSNDDAIDGPDSMFEVYCHDACIEIKEIMNTPLAESLKRKRDNILNDLMSEGETDQGPAVMGPPRM